MESMIVAAKTYERDQTSEKVRIKMRLRQEKGLHQGGLVPFGFTMDSTTKMLHPRPGAGRQGRADLPHLRRTPARTLRCATGCRRTDIPSPRGEASGA
jgi:hypothetical protein